MVRNHKENVITFNHYSLKEINVWDYIQLVRPRNRFSELWVSLALHYEVERIDPKWSWRLIWKEMTPITSKKTWMFHVSKIYRNYRLNPIIITKDWYKAKQTEFTRKPL